MLPFYADFSFKGRIWVLSGKEPEIKETTGWPSYDWGLTVDEIYESIAKKAGDIITAQLERETGSRYISLPPIKYNPTYHYPVSYFPPLMIGAGSTVKKITSFKLLD
jgi:hypothetical protein